MGQLPEQTQANLSDADRPAPAARGQRDGAARRAGSPVDDRAPARGRPRRAARDVVLRAAARTAPQPAADARDAASCSCSASSPRPRAMYTDKHPEVQRLQEELETARSDAQAERAEAGVRSRGAAARSIRRYRQLIADREMARLRIRDLQRSEADCGGRSAPTRRASSRRRGRAAARLACSATTTSRSSSTPSCRRSSTPRRSPRTSSAIAAASSSRCSTRRRCPTEPIKPVPLARDAASSIVAGICLGAGADARPRVPRPLGSRRARTAGRVRSAGARRSDAHSAA